MYKQIISMIDKVADSVESKGLYREAELLDIVANTFSDLIKNEPHWLSNKISIVTRDATGKATKIDEGRVYSDKKPTAFPNIWKEGPDGKWYLQDSDAMSLQIYPDRQVLFDDGTDKGFPAPDVKIINIKKYSFEALPPRD